MPKTRAQKNDEVTALTQAFKSGKSAFFADYQGMKVSAMSALRKQLRQAGVDYLVGKKTLLGLAAKAAGYDVDFRALPGMLGVAFASEDEMAPAKLIGDAGKTATIKLMGGIFEGKVIDQAFAVALSKLPNKKQLLGQLLSVMNGPMSALARLLNARREKLESNA